MKNFNELVNDLQYVHVDDTQLKSATEVGEEIRDIIRNNGWACLEEFEDADDWAEDNGIDTAGYEWASVAEADFLCANTYCIEHDVDWHTFTISFYGIWGESGVFDVQ